MVSLRSRERSDSCWVRCAMAICRPELAATSAAKRTHWSALPNGSPPACAPATVTALANSPTRCAAVPGISSSASMKPEAA
jgi:hypothetical protein